MDSGNLETSHCWCQKRNPSIGRGFLRGTWEALIIGGGGLSSLPSVPLFPLFLTHPLYFLPVPVHPGPPHLTLDQSRVTTGTHISLWSARPSHLTPTLKALACHGKLRTSERYHGKKKFSNAMATNHEHWPHLVTVLYKT